MHEHERYLTERDLAMLDFVFRYRAGTEDMFSCQFFPETDSHKNVTRVLGRLQGRGLLRKESCDHGLSYYTLTPRGYRALGLAPRTPRPLTEQSLPVVLAVAFYCVGNGLRRLTCKEFTELYPELWRPGMRASNYLLVDIDGKLRLELLLVDRGGAAHRINARVRRVIAQRKGLPKFHALMKAGRFRITVLTGTREQARKIERRVRRRPFGPIEVTTFVIPELADLLMLRK